MIPQDLKEKLKKILGDAHSPREALVDVIMGYQQHSGWLDDEGVRNIAEITGVSPLQIEELATFYNLIFRELVGKKVILICDSISCSMMGSEKLVDHLKKKLNVELGGTTYDGMFTLLPICCLGNCGEAPAMLIGEKLYGNLTPEKIDRILEKEKEDTKEEEGS